MSVVVEKSGNNAAGRRQKQCEVTSWHTKEGIWPPQERTAQLTALDDETVPKNQNEILKIFAKHFDQLLNMPENVDDTSLNTIADRPTIQSLHETPDYEELTKAIAVMMENKGPGRCSLPAEVWKYETSKLKKKLCKLIFSIWENEQLPITGKMQI